jgi:hypothetical protein
MWVLQTTDPIQAMAEPAGEQPRQRETREILFCHLILLDCQLEELGPGKNKPYLAKSQSKEKRCRLTSTWQRGPQASRVAASWSPAALGLSRRMETAYSRR